MGWHMHINILNKVDGLDSSELARSCEYPEWRSYVRDYEDTGGYFKWRILKLLASDVELGVLEGFNLTKEDVLDFEETDENYQLCHQVVTAQYFNYVKKLEKISLYKKVEVAKSLFLYSNKDKIFRYAIEHKIVDKYSSEYVSIPKEVAKNIIAMSSDRFCEGNLQTLSDYTDEDNTFLLCVDRDVL